MSATTTQIQFDPNAAPDVVSSDPIPAGDYKVMVDSTEVKRTKNGDGMMAVVALKVVEGEYAGRLVWDRILFAHPNEKAAAMGQARLKSLCTACGWTQRLSDTAVLHDKVVLAKVKVAAGRDGYDPSNEVKKYAPLGDPGAPAPTVEQRPAQAQQTRPW